MPTAHHYNYSAELFLVWLHLNLWAFWQNNSTDCGLNSSAATQQAVIVSCERESFMRMLHQNMTYNITTWVRFRIKLFITLLTLSEVNLLL